MTTWLVVGASPLAPAAVLHARDHHRPDRTLASNGAIRLFGRFCLPGGPAGDWWALSDYLLTVPPALQLEHWTAADPLPDCFFLSDGVACRMYGPAARQAQALGTRLVTPLRVPSALRDRGVQDFDEFCDLEGFEDLRLSGLFFAEYAARQGAARVLLAGMDGYENGEQCDNYFFEGAEHRRPYHRGHSQNVIPQTMDALFTRYPAVEWVTLGAPRWKPKRESYPNWRVESPTIPDAHA